LNIASTPQAPTAGHPTVRNMEGNYACPEQFDETITRIVTGG
jgi:hypothetical protein